MKKIISVLLLVTIACTMCLASCGKNNVVGKETENALATLGEGAPEGNYKFGIVTQVENGAFVDMKEGIISALEKAGYTSANTTIDYQCAQGDATTLSTICASMDNSSYTAVFTIATPATQTFVNLDSDVPNFFCAVSAPVAANVITDMNTPDKNSTGTSNAIPTSEIIKLADKLTPGITKWGFIYCTAQANSTNTVNSACEYLDSINVDYTVKTVENSDEVSSVTQSLIASGAKAIFVPNDSIVQAGVSALAEICEDEKIPTYCASATTVASGCFATLAIDDKGIGEKTAALALKYLSGEKIENIPAIVVDIDYCTVNEKLAKSLGVTVPAEDALGYKLKLLNK